MKRVLLACVGVLALGGAASAADLPVAPAPYYKSPVYAPAYNWTGFYLGINGGGGWGRSTWTTTGQFDMSGGLVGGTIGYNYQIEPGRARRRRRPRLGQYQRQHEHRLPSATGTGCQTSNNWLARSADVWAMRLTASCPTSPAAPRSATSRPRDRGSPAPTRPMPAGRVGGGLEFAIAGHWTAKAEYLYVDLGSVSTAAQPAALPCRTSTGTPTSSASA